MRADGTDDPNEKRPEGMSTDAALGLRKELERARPHRVPWVVALEEAFKQLRSTPEGRERYGDPETGGTLDQAFNATYAISGAEYVCLFVPDRVATPVTIPEVESMSARELVETLSRILSQSRAAVTANVRGKFAHAITMLEVDDHGLCFHDPWPGTSLLAKERGFFGDVDVTEVGGRWRIEPSDLEKIIYAVLVHPLNWAKHTNRPYAVRYATLLASDFFRFFRLREVAQCEAEKGRTARRIEPGAFHECVHLELATTPHGYVATAELAVARSWLHSQEGLFAADIVRSFIRAVVALPDQTTVEPAANIVHAVIFRDLNGNEIASTRPGMDRAVLAVLGEEAETTMTLNYTAITFSNAARDGWLTVRVVML